MFPEPVTLTPEQVVGWCAQLLDRSGAFPPLEVCLDAIPTLDALDDLLPGTRVLVRCDTNVALADGRAADDARLRSLLETLLHGHKRGWVQIVHGHHGDDGRQSLEPVAVLLETLLRQEGAPSASIHFLPSWMDDATGAVLDEAAEAVTRLSPGSFALLENARRHSLEQCLRKATAADLPALAPRLCRYANDVRTRLAAVHVNEGFAASNRDLSSTLVPFAVDRVALGRHVRHELRRVVEGPRQAELVVFSGAKLPKLDDLQAILARGHVRLIVVAGFLALPFLEADALLHGRHFERGRAEVPAARVEQARQILHDGGQQGVEFVLPLDFVLEDGSVRDTIPAGGAHYDIGPETLTLQARKLDEFLLHHRARQAAGRGPACAFHNGVFGVFEDERFAHGTRQFMAQLRRLHDAGVQVFVGGGEGGAALRRFGDESWVTHCFTAGGTILKALGTEPIPYVRALYLATRLRRP
jgi:phosphoglycerate kinase